ncbi:DUF1642 domain-containing protein [Streptococcus phocae subsp. phocae]
MNINELKKGDKVWVRGFIDYDGDLVFGDDLTYIKSLQIYTIDKEDIRLDGYAEQSPKHLKNIIAKLRELPEHDKKAWIEGLFNELGGARDVSYYLGSLKGASQAKESLKPEVSREVAEWIEKSKGFNSDLYSLLEGPEDYSLDGWIDEKENQEIIVKAMLFGYTVKEEKLYKVKIHGAHLFKMTSENQVRFKMFYNFMELPDEEYDCTDELTEQEIKQADERFWDWAEEVEDEH